MVSMNDGGLHSIGDGIDHRVHGRYGVQHLLPWVEMQQRRRSLGELPPSLPLSVSGVKASVSDSVLEENVSMDEMTVRID
jgi:hypothetical protein